MSDGPDSLVLRFMRQVDAKLDRVIDDLADIKVRVTNVEENLVALNRRVDRMDLRIERIERRLDLTEINRLTLIRDRAASSKANSPGEDAASEGNSAVRQSTLLPPRQRGRRYV